MSARSMLRTLALVLAATVVPAAAYADDAPGKRGAAAERGEREGRGPGKERGERPSFPMKGADFVQHVEKKISRVRARVVEGMEKRNLPEGVRKQVLAEVDAGAAKVRGAAQKAAADGSVTKEEAKAVRELAHEVKRDLREKAGLPAGKEARKGKGKGKGHGKDRKGSDA